MHLSGPRARIRGGHLVGDKYKKPDQLPRRYSPIRSIGRLISQQRPSMALNRDRNPTCTVQFAYTPPVSSSQTAQTPNGVLQQASDPAMHQRMTQDILRLARHLLQLIVGLRSNYHKPVPVCTPCQHCFSSRTSQTLLLHCPFHSWLFPTHPTQKTRKPD